jgi:DNA-directed RNA polymerase specialized sigma24 family protein
MAYLTMRERITVVAYVDGWGAKYVACAMGVSCGTVKETIKRVRARYRDEGRDAGTKIHLSICLTEDGYLN